MAQKSRAETVAALKRVPLFSSLNKRQLTAVAKVTDYVDFEPGAVMIKEMDVGQRLIVIREGSAKVTRQGASRRLATVGPGDVVGELSLIDGRPTSASVVAETAVEALVLYRTVFLKLLDSMPELGRGLLVGLTARVRATDRRAAVTG